MKQRYSSSSEIWCQICTICNLEFGHIDIYNNWLYFERYPRVTYEYRNIYINRPK